MPIRHYIHAIRTIMIKGGGLAEVQPQLTALVILDGVIVSLAVINLRRRLD